MRVLWTARRSNQSIPKEISPEYSLEELMLKLKLQYFGHLVQRTDPLEKTLMLGKIEGVRPDPGGYDGPPLLSLPLAGGKSLTVGASQIPGTNDSTLHQLKPPYPSHIEGPISPCDTST